MSQKTQSATHARAAAIPPRSEEAIFFLSFRENLSVNLVCRKINKKKNNCGPQAETQFLAAQLKSTS